MGKESETTQYKEAKFELGFKGEKKHELVKRYKEKYLPHAPHHRT